MDKIPPSYHQGLITSETVILAFSLAFIRYWSFEAQGTWWWGAVVSEIFLVTSIILQLFVLIRALSLKNDNVPEYNKTLRWFLFSVSILIAGILFSTIIYSDAFHK